jgi:hypothetical protein
MQFVQRLSLYVSVTSMLLLLIGLFRPWVTLWWEDVQNRKKVIALYGSITVVSFVLYLIIIYIS